MTRIRQRHRCRGGTGAAPPPRARVAGQGGIPRQNRFLDSRDSVGVGNAAPAPRAPVPAAPAIARGSARVTDPALPACSTGTEWTCCR